MNENTNQQGSLLDMPMPAVKTSKLEELVAKLCPDGVEFVTLGSVSNISMGEFVRKDKQNPKGKYPVYNGGTTNTGFYDTYNTTKNKIIISARGAAGFVNRVFSNFWAGNSCFVIDINNKSLLWDFVYYFLKKNQSNLIGKQQRGSIPAVSKKQIEALLIPILPIPVQEEIVRILDTFAELTAELTAELAKRKQQYQYYRDELLTFGDDVKWKSLGNIAINYDSKRKPVTKGNRQSGCYPYYGASGIVDYVDDYIFDGDYLLVSEDGANLLARKTSIAFSISGKNWVNNHAHILFFEDSFLRKYVEIYLNSISLEKYISTATQPKLTQDNLNKILIPVPKSERLHFIVSILDRFDALCNDLSSGLPAEINARKKQYEYYRDKLLTFKELPK